MAIVVITNREMEQEIPRLVREMNANFTHAHGTSVKIFVNSMTAPEASGFVEREITCENSGIWNRLPRGAMPTSNLTTLYERVNGYYRVLSRSLHVREPVWSEIGSAPQGFVIDGTGLCLPVYNRSRELHYREVLGVSCTVLPQVEAERIDPGGWMEVGKVGVRQVTELKTRLDVV